jgi:hypothetical protein
MHECTREPRSRTPFPDRPHDDAAAYMTSGSSVKLASDLTPMSRHACTVTGWFFIR